MKTTGNTILITGGGSGIGRGLAEAFHALGNQVIVAGRRKQALDQTTAANPGMASMVLDIEDPAHIRSFAAQVAKQYPALNVLINNAGIMRIEKLQAQPDDLAHAESIIAINLLGPIRLTAALLPLLQKTAPVRDYERLPRGWHLSPWRRPPPIARRRPQSIPIPNRSVISSTGPEQRFSNWFPRMSRRT